MDVTFALQPILPISVGSIRAPAQLWAPTTLKIGFIGIVLGGCEAGGAVLVGMRFIPVVSHIDNRGEAVENRYLVHIAGLQGTEHNRCLVPYVLVLHVQSMIFIDGLPSSNWKYMVNILSSRDDYKLSLTVNGPVNDVSIR